MNIISVRILGSLVCMLLCPSLWAQTGAAAAPVVAVDEPVKAPATTAASNSPTSATINLQTTITGNQEQPQVLYILPWQSPLSPEMDLELLSSKQTGVFGHIEREELQRSLEAAGKLDEPEL